MPKTTSRIELISQLDEAKGDLYNLQKSGRKDGKIREKDREEEEEKLREEIKKCIEAINNLQENRGEAGGVRLTLRSLSLKLEQVKEKLAELYPEEFLKKENDKVRDDIVNEKEALEKDISKNRRLLLKLDGPKAIKQFAQAIKDFQKEQVEDSEQQSSKQEENQSTTITINSEEFSVSSNVASKILEGASTAGGSVQISDVGGKVEVDVNIPVRNLNIDSLIGENIVGNNSGPKSWVARVSQHQNSDQQRCR